MGLTGDKVTYADGFSSKDVDRGDWIELYNGKKFYVLDPDADVFNSVLISHALSNLCRFGGHTSKFYSVAEHSVGVANRLYARYKDRELAYKGLYHDGSEAVLVDIPRPIKPSLTNYKVLEKKVQECIYTKMCGGLPTEEEEALIKQADMEMLWIEGYQLMPSKTAIWESDGDRNVYLPIAIGQAPLPCHAPYEAKREFHYHDAFFRTGEWPVRHF